MEKVLILAAVGIIGIDAVVVYVANANGMKYPFMAAAIANLMIVVATHIIGITVMLARR